MSAPVDEIDVGHDPRVPWRGWSPWRGRSRRWRAVVVGLAVVLVVAAAATTWVVRRATTAAPVAASAPDLRAPGADTEVDLGIDRSKCPTGAQCTYRAQVSDATETAFRESFTSAGYIGRQSVVDAVTGAVYWQLIRFTTGTLVTVTLTQQAVAQVPNLPAVVRVPTYLDLGESALTVNAVRSGYLMTASAATLPGQALPVRAARRWVDVVPAP